MSGFDPEDPRLLEKIKSEYLDRRFKGEDKNRKLIFLICCSAFTKHPLSAIVKGCSGAGKSRLVNSVLDVFRKMGCVIEFSRITPAYLENMAKKDRKPRLPVRQLKEAGVSGREIARLEEQLLNKFGGVDTSDKPRTLDLNGKILFIDELRGIQNAQSPKLLISEGRLRLGTVIDGQPVEIEITGTPVIITTTALVALEDPELENRVIPVQIDEGEDQTRTVLKAEASEYEDPIRLQDPIEDQLVDLLNKMRPYDTANPYANELADKYPANSIQARRDFRKLMGLIGVTTWLHQYQREHRTKLVDVVVVTDPRDVHIVMELALEPLRESFSGVSQKEQPILDWLKRQLDDIKETVSVEGRVVERPVYQARTVRQIYESNRKVVRKGEQWTRDHVKRLVDEGYVEEEEVTPKRFVYRYSPIQPQAALEINDGFSKEVLETWAARTGYKLHTPASPTRLERSQIPAGPTPATLSETKNYPNSDFGEFLASGQFEGAQTQPSSDLSKSSPSVPQEDQSTVVDTCSLCREKRSLLLNPLDHTSLVCKECRRTRCQPELTVNE